METGGESPLEAYFDSVEEGPGIWKWRHYFDIYHRHFGKFVGRPVRIVEIGIYSGGSLGMWRSYFGDQAQIYGVDIEPACRTYEREGIEIFIGDQGDRDFWERFKRQVPELDIVVDDGGHLVDQQITTLEALLPHMRAGGVFLCEDIASEIHPFHSYVDALGRHLHTLVNAPHGHQHTLVNPPHGLHQHIESIHRYPQVTVIEKPWRRLSSS